MRHLFVVAHPDDECLGGGAFIYDAVRRGDGVAALVLNTCDTTRYEDDHERIVADLRESHRILGISKFYRGRYVDSNMNNADHRDMVQFIEGAIRDFKPDNIFTQHPGDVNTDHFWCAASCFEAFHLFQRGREEANPVSGLYLMEVQSSTDWAVNPSEKRFEPNTFIEVSGEGLMMKIEALKVYENVIRPVPHPRSFEALTALPILRGAQAGYQYAEAFECVFRRGL